MTRSVLYLSYDGMTDPLGQSQVLPYLLGLCDHGYSFHIVSFEKPTLYKSHKQEIEQVLSRKPIIWHPQEYHKTPPVLSTVFDLMRMQKVAASLIRKYGVKLIHCRSYISGLAGMNLQKRYGVKFLFDIRGFWADERVDGGIWSLKNPIFKFVYDFFKRREIEMMHAADHIISLTHTGKDEITSGRLFKNKSQGINESKITVIPCAVDRELFDPAKVDKKSREELKNSLGLSEGDKVIVYLGSIGTWYMLDEMLMYFKEYLAKEPKSYFLFVTKDDPDYIINKAVTYGIDQDRIIVRSAGRKEVPLYLSIASFGIFFIKPLYSKKASSATKMGEMLAMGLDIVCNEIGDVSRLNLKKKQVAGLPFNLCEISGSNNLDQLIDYDLSEGIARYLHIYRSIL